jgi:hypothetical protein
MWGCSQGDFVPQSIVKAETNSILFNGHDRQPSDKIFKFIRESENEPWRLQVLDYISNNLSSLFSLISSFSKKLLIFCAKIRYGPIEGKAV